MLRVLKLSILYQVTRSYVLAIIEKTRMRFKNILKSILLRVWGEDASASYLQMHHFTYSVGAFLAPLVVAPFYESSAEDLCDSENNQDGEISS